jgi:hypothetical protein
MIVAIAVVSCTPLYAAASTVTGTVSCTTEGELWFRSPGLPEELAEPLTKPLAFKANTASTSCDGSGVVGARGPVTSVDVRFIGKLAPETSCGDFLGTVALTAKVQLHWHSHEIGGPTLNIGSSRATVASATYDSNSQFFVVTTNPIRGAFADSTLTLRFALDEASYADRCMNHDLRYAGWIFNGDNPLLVDVQ